MSLFHVATDEEIKRGKTTDVYFSRTKQIIEAKSWTSLGRWLRLRLVSFQASGLGVSFAESRRKPACLKDAQSMFTPCRREAFSTTRIIGA